MSAQVRPFMRTNHWFEGGALLQHLNCNLILTITVAFDSGNDSLLVVFLDQHCDKTLAKMCLGLQERVYKFSMLLLMIISLEC